MKTPPKSPQNPKKASPNNLPSTLPNAKVEIGNFLDCPAILSQSKAHPRGEPLLTPSFPKLPTVSQGDLTDDWNSGRKN
jgi:hypothetical protein